MSPAPSVEEFRQAASSHQRDLVLLNYTADEVESVYESLPRDPELGEEHARRGSAQSGGHDSGLTAIR